MRARLAFLVALAASAPALQAKAEPWRLHDAIRAPSNLKLSASFRGRYETIDGQARAGLPDNENVYEIRSILAVEYAPGPLRFGLDIYDSRAFGADPGTAVTANDVNTFEPVQAYVAADFKNLLGAGSSGTVKLGRFTMDIGSRRLVTNEDYRNTTNGFTGLHLDARLANGATLAAFYSAPQVRLPDDQTELLDQHGHLDRESSDLLFWGVAAAGHGPAGFDLDGSYLALRERDAVARPTRDRDLTTLSARIFRPPQPGHFDAEAEGAWQTGQISDSTAPNAAKLDVSAGYLHLRAGYQFDVAWSPRVALEYEWASGDRPGGDFTRFDTLFGSRRFDYGPSGLYNAVGRANIVSPGVRLEVTPSRRMDALITFRPLWLASKTDAFATTAVRDPSGASGDDAGDQIEGRLRYWVVPDALRFEANGAVLRKGRFLKTAPNAPADTAPARYLSAALTWSF